jgi:hypothetical protein
MSSGKRTAIGRITLCVGIALTAAPLALAQSPGAGPTPAVGDDPLGRLLLALGVLLVLAQGAEQLTQLLRALLTNWFGCKYAAATGSAAHEAARAAGVDDAQRKLLLTNWSLVTGMAVAIICGVDTFEVFGTGAVTAYGPAGLLDHWPGFFASGLIASMGSGFLHDLIGIVKALKETKDELLKQEQKKSQ